MAVVGYWRLNGNSNDASGNGNNGSDTAIAYSQANGVLNGGAGFNSASSSKIVLTYINSSSGVVSVLVKINSTSAENEIITSNQDLNGSANYINIGIGAGGVMLVYQESPAKYCWTDGIIGTGVWYYLVYRQSGSVVEFFKNGVKQTILTQSGTQTQWLAAASRNKLCMGMFERGTQQYNKLNGSLDELMIDSAAWSDGNIKNKYSYYKGFF